MCESSKFALFFKTVLAILGPLHFLIIFAKQFKLIAYTTDKVFEYLLFSKRVLVVLKFLFEQSTQFDACLWQKTRVSPAGMYVSFQGIKIDF